MPNEKDVPGIAWAMRRAYGEGALAHMERRAQQLARDGAVATAEFWQRVVSALREENLTPAS
jgi:hypothetical protein